MSATRPFHLAFPVDDLEAARDFYGTVMGCPQGREEIDVWIDYDLYGHQIVAHLDPSRRATRCGRRTPSTATRVPIPHFGVVLTVEQFEALRGRLEARGGHPLGHPPARALRGPAGRAAHDVLARSPRATPLEFKAFADDAQLFAT